MCGLLHFCLWIQTDSGKSLQCTALGLSATVERWSSLFLAGDHWETWHVSGRAGSSRVPLWCRGDLREWRVAEIPLGSGASFRGLTHPQHTPQVGRVRWERHQGVAEWYPSHIPKPHTLHTEIVAVLVETHNMDDLLLLYLVFTTLWMYDLKITWLVECKAKARVQISSPTQIPFCYRLQPQHFRWS